jgi:hypothetical protein
VDVFLGVDMEQSKSVLNHFKNRASFFQDNCPQEHDVPATAKNVFAALKSFLEKGTLASNFPPRRYFLVSFTYGHTGDLSFEYNKHDSTLERLVLNAFDGRQGGHDMMLMIQHHLDQNRLSFFYGRDNGRGFVNGSKTSIDISNRSRNQAISDILNTICNGPSSFWPFAGVFSNVKNYATDKPTPVPA